MTDMSEEMYQWASDLFPICRSITGQGVRDTLSYLQTIIPSLKVHSVKSGTKVFDWEVPNEWLINDAYIEDSAGNRVIDFKANNLHIVGYSAPVNKVIRFSELKSNLYYLENMPNAIPYITSYYKENWGFCLTHNQYLEMAKFPDAEYRVVIDSKLFPGVLNYGEVIIPGSTQEEVFLSTYICHPSLANNELSGPVVTTALARSLLKLGSSHKYSYRIVFIPETIGSITYLANHLTDLKNNVVAGFNLTCVGDDRSYSYLPSRQGNTLADKAALHVLKHLTSGFVQYSFLDRGSDERQYCSPGVDLPVCSIMRTKYAEYPEYHTSLDNLDLISPSGLLGAYKVVRTTIECLEINETLKTTVLGEPQLGKRGLYPNTSTKESRAVVADMMNFIGYCDGSLDALAIAEKIGVSLWSLKETINKLKYYGLLVSDD